MNDVAGVSWYAVMKLLHVLSAFWVVTGMLARPVVLAAARRAPDMRILKAIADVSGRLEDLMVAPGLLAVLVTGVATALIGGIPLFGPFAGGPSWVFLSLLIMLLVVALTPVTLMRDRRWGQALEEAAREGAVTARLRTFLTRDAMIRRYAPDVVVMFVIVTLMVTKPF